MGRLIFWGKFIAFSVTFTILSEFFYCSLKSIIKKDKKPKNKTITDVLFFSDQSAMCRTHSNSPISCGLETCPIENINKLMSYLESATKSLEICMYFLTYNAVVKLLKDLFQKDVDIRIITDDESTENDASQIFMMRQIGIKVRTKKSLYLMHHKFAIIDKKLLITGSANWTIQAFYGNCENIIVTNQPRIVRSFMQEFEILWSKFDIDYITEFQINEKLKKEAEEKRKKRLKIEN